MTCKRGSLVDVLHPQSARLDRVYGPEDDGASERLNCPQRSICSLHIAVEVQTAIKTGELGSPKQRNKKDTRARMTRPVRGPGRAAKGKFDSTGGFGSSMERSCSLVARVLHDSAFVRLPKMLLDRESGLLPCRGFASNSFLTRACLAQVALVNPVCQVIACPETGPPSPVYCVVDLFIRNQQFDLHQLRNRV